MNKNDLQLTGVRRATIRREVAALEEVLIALTPLVVDERQRLVRWVCDYYGLDPMRMAAR